MSSVQHEFALLLFARLRQAGITDLVISPGSRNSPWVIAALLTAGLRCHDVLDERVAGFMALGMVRAVGRPVALLCTSGTAGAHYLPAVIEASEAGQGLLVLTADRPPERVGAGAPQAVDQVRLYGGFVRHFEDLEAASTEISALYGLVGAIDRALLRMTASPVGPVHLNLRARKPLEPTPPATAEERALSSAMHSVVSSRPPPVAAGRRVVVTDALDGVVRVLAGCRRGLIVAGPMAPSLAASRDAVAELARSTGFPLAAEAASQLRFGAGQEGVLRLGALDHLAHVRAFDGVEVVVQIGRAPVSGAVARWLESSAARRVVLGEDSFFDWIGSADWTVLGDVDATLRNLASGVGRRDSPTDGAWRDGLQSREARWVRALRSLEGVSEGSVAREVVRVLAPGDALMIGNSLSARVVDWFVEEAAPLEVLSQRGASGIDGLVSGAIGSSMVAGRPTTLLIGDVAMAHDLSGLAEARRVIAPLVIVVLDNGGGRIFDLLPVADRPNLPARLMETLRTPPRVDLELACRAYGVAYEAPKPGAVGDAVRSARCRAGATVLHVELSADGLQGHLATLRRAVGSVG